MSNYILFFDTETTGLPDSWSAPYTDVDNWPRIIQLAWQAYTPEGKQVAQHSTLIKPEGWEVPTGKFWIDNGYSTERCAAEGKPIEGELLYFLYWCRNSSILCAHNIRYDRNVIGAELHRLGYELPDREQLPRVCTMNSSTKFCKIPNSNGRGGYKWPRLEELYFLLFGEVFDNAHDAGADVEATARCYFELSKRGVL